VFVYRLKDKDIINRDYYKILGKSNYGFKCG